MLCTEHGPPELLVLADDVPEPEAGPGQVVMDVAYAAMNFPDLLTIQGKYQIKPEPPFSPGFEGAGIVASVGPEVHDLHVGDRIAAVGVVGAFADKWVVDAERCVPMPAAIPFDIAAATIIAYATSYHALMDRAALKAGETMLVLGAAGGVGSSAIEIGTMMGAHVIAGASTDEKLAFCRELGAAETINYTTQDLRTAVKELTGGDGIDVVYDPVGGELSEQAFRSLRWRGRHLVIGFTAGEIPRVPWNLALLKEASVVGVYWGGLTEADPGTSDRYMRELVALIADGTLRPRVTASFPLSDFLDAYTMVRSRTARGKVVLRIADR